MGSGASRPATIANSACGGNTLNSQDIANAAHAKDAKVRSVKMEAKGSSTLSRTIEGKAANTEEHLKRSEDSSSALDEARIRADNNNLSAATESQQAHLRGKFEGEFNHGKDEYDEAEEYEYEQAIRHRSCANLGDVRDSVEEEIDAKNSELFAYTAMSMGMDNDDLLFNLLYFGGGESSGQAGAGDIGELNIGQLYNTAMEETIAAHSENNTPYKLRPASEKTIERLSSKLSRRLTSELRLDDYECSVCKDEMCEGDEVSLLAGCRHCFHADCLVRWVKLQGWCPVCRSTIDVGNTPRQPVEDRDDPKLGIDCLKSATIDSSLDARRSFDLGTEIDEEEYQRQHTSDKMQPYFESRRNAEEDDEENFITDELTVRILDRGSLSHREYKCDEARQHAGKEEAITTFARDAVCGFIRMSLERRSTS